MAGRPEPYPSHSDRQSAYQRGALAADHGAARIDVVHRHPAGRAAAGHRPAVLEVGGLTLEPWLTARLPPARVRRWPETLVTEATAARGNGARVRLSKGARRAGAILGGPQRS